MGFIAICTAIYDYQPQSENELEIHEGELLYILEKGTEDDWWKAKKRVAGDEEDEPEGLIPNNYVEEARPTHVAKALYDYTRQTDEEISFSEDTSLDVYDTSDPDWTLIGLNGEFGFAPANYIELSGATPRSPSISSSRRATTSFEPAGSPTQSAHSPAANLARVLGAGVPPSPTATRRLSSSRVPHQQFTPEASDGENEEPPPALPRRPLSQSISSPTTQYASTATGEAARALPSPPYNRAPAREEYEEPIGLPGGFHMYSVSEMVSAMGKRKKMPTILGLNIATGTIMLSPQKSQDGQSQEWTVEKMTHYSIEGKHVFLELIRPSRSLDLHAGAKDTAQEIVAALGEIAGAHRGEGLKEIIAAVSGSNSQKEGKVLCDFMAQDEDEVTVAIGDEVIILDDTKSEEWWNVRRLINGKEGVVPSSFIEITGTIAVEPPSRTGVNAGKSTVEQNRLEEHRLAKAAARSNRNRDERESDSPKARGLEVGPGLQLPQRGSSLAEDDSRRTQKREKRASKSEGKSSRSKPDPTKTRTWTDHSGSFKVDAQFIGVADGKIHLHKQNGVKIAVPIVKMSPEDLEYVEKATNESMDDYLPLAMVVERKRRAASAVSPSTVQTGVVTDKNSQPKAPEYDWFDFFLQAGVGPHQCERYAQSMTKDSMDESVLPDVTPEVLRTLGLKEGDALKVMKHLDQRFGRTRSQAKGSTAETNGDSSAGGIFSGPGGALRDNTRRGRPEAKRQTSDVVDSKAFQAGENSEESPQPPAKRSPVHASSADNSKTGFDDDAWEVRPSRSVQAVPQRPPTQLAPAQQPQSLSGAMADLSLLTPLQPTVASPQPNSNAPAIQQQQQPPGPPMVTAAPVQSQATGANPSFFSQLGQQPNGPALQGQMQSYLTQPSASQQWPQVQPPRQRPQAPLPGFTGTSLLPPPPRPLSAPQNLPQQNRFGLAPLQPQLTGVPRTLQPQAPPGQSLDELNQQRFQQQYMQSQLQAQQTGFIPQTQGFVSYPNNLPPQLTGLNPSQQLGGFQSQPQQFMNGNVMNSPFADPRPSFSVAGAPQQPGFSSYQQQGSTPGGVNALLPPALQPQNTAFNTASQPSQVNGFQQGMQSQITGFQQPLQSQATAFQQPLPPQITSYQAPQQSGFGSQTGQPQVNGFNNFQLPPLPPIPQQSALAPLQPQKTGPAPLVRFGVAEAKKLTPQPTGRRANLSHATPSNPFGF